MGLKLVVIMLKYFIYIFSSILELIIYSLLAIHFFEPLFFSLWWKSRYNRDIINSWNIKTGCLKTINGCSSWNVFLIIGTFIIFHIHATHYLVSNLLLRFILLILGCVKVIIFFTITVFTLIRWIKIVCLLLSHTFFSTVVSSKYNSKPGSFNFILLLSLYFLNISNHWSMRWWHKTCNKWWTTSFHQLWNYSSKQESVLEKCQIALRSCLKQWWNYQLSHLTLNSLIC